MGRGMLTYAVLFQEDGGAELIALKYLDTVCAVWLKISDGRPISILPIHSSLNPGHMYVLLI